jgi:hypothetical protein
MLRRDTFLIDKEIIDVENEAQQRQDNKHSSHGDLSAEALREYVPAKRAQ